MNAAPVNAAPVNADRLLDLYERIGEAPDAIARLRRFVLDLAVRGKLVEQNPADEPASELLKRIAKERDGFRAGRKPKKQAQESKLDGGPSAEIPDDWEWGTLSDISLRLHYGYTASADPSLKTVRLLRITDIQDNCVNWDTVPGCNIDEKSLAGYLLDRTFFFVTA